MQHSGKSLSGLFCTILLGTPQVAADVPLRTQVAIELNAVESVDQSCRISFLIQNGHVADIAQAVYEAVLFDTEGGVDRLTLFGFGALPAARPRVRQFLVPDIGCARLGRVLINGAETCAGGSDLPEGACMTDLDLRSRTDVELLG